MMEESSCVMMMRCLALYCDVARRNCAGVTKGLDFFLTFLLLRCIVFVVAVVVVVSGVIYTRVVRAWSLKKDWC